MGTDRSTLLVEDDPEVARAILRALVVEGYSPTIAPSCAAARGVGDGFRVGVFDVELRDGHGTDVARELIRAGRVDRAIFFTATTQEALLRDAATLGVVIAKRDGIATLIHEVQLAAGDTPPDAAPRSDSGIRQRVSHPGWHYWRNEVG